MTWHRFRIDCPGFVLESRHGKPLKVDCSWFLDVLKCHFITEYLPNGFWTSSVVLKSYRGPPGCSKNKIESVTKSERQKTWKTENPKTKIKTYEPLMDSSEKIILSIIIPTFNRVQILWDTLQPLTMQLEGKDEILIIDQNTPALEIPQALQNRGLPPCHRW